MSQELTDHNKTMSLSKKWIAFRTIWFKEVRRILRIWPQTLLPPVITMSLYFVIFGKMIGSRSQFMPIVCLLISLAPQTKSDNAAAERSTNTGISKLTPI